MNSLENLSLFPGYVKFGTIYKAQFICDRLSFSNEKLGSMFCITAVTLPPSFSMQAGSDF